MEEKRGGRDQRKNPRIEFHIRANVRGRKEPQEVTNFGLYGIFLKTDDASEAKPGDALICSIHLPHEDRGLELKGKVAHVTKEGVGVVFPDISPQDAMAMETCFHIFKETLPLPDEND